MDENKTPETDEKKPDDQLEDLIPEKDPTGGNLVEPDAQKKEITDI